MTLTDLAALVRGTARRIGFVTVRASHRHPPRGPQVVSPACAAVTWTGADLLAHAARLLSQTPGRYTPSAIHETLFELARVHRGDADSGAAHRMADEAEALLAAYLVDVFQAPPCTSVAQTLRAWPDRRDHVPAAAAMTAAARHWKGFLIAPRRWRSPRARWWPVKPHSGDGCPDDVPGVAEDPCDPRSLDASSGARPTGALTARQPMPHCPGAPATNTRPRAEDWPGNPHVSPAGDRG
ncbi:hypothetical protein [Phytohabitans rumicis]|uniref:Uncharacterized protein n=1 Tax=Phytohabitans rumicis TaxID=1076125 RepID=A0A6V8LEM3_9ACTN|nr:hypothetical protein [Phytohabitans rumicis]GFJ93261.1 hypothetical protein Prum_069030 [Phytohabitans rumicis]